MGIAQGTCIRRPDRQHSLWKCVSAVPGAALVCDSGRAVFQRTESILLREVIHANTTSSLYSEKFNMRAEHMGKIPCMLYFLSIFGKK